MKIIFDCDGVLRSASWEGMFQAYKLIAESKGIKYTDCFKDLEDFKKWWHPDWHINNRKLGITPGEAAGINLMFHRIYDPYVFVFDWVREILSILAQNHDLALLSASSETSIEISLKDVRDYFKFMVCAEQVSKLKPDPEGIKLIMSKFPGLSLSEFIMIGDMKVDILAGKSAGIKTGAVNWGLGEKEKLLALGPDMFFETPEDLLKI